VSVRRVFESKNYILTKSAVIFINAKNLNKFTSNAQLINEFQMELKFFVFELDKFSVEVAGATAVLPSTIYPFMTFIQYDPSSDSIRLWTPSWFQSCGNLKGRILNIYSMKTQKWSRKLEVVDMFGNMNKCPYYVMAGHGVFMRDFDDVDYTYVHKIGEVLGKRLNFTPIFTQKLKKADLCMLTTLYEFRDRYFITSSFKMDKIQVVISPAEPYSSYEKLLFPFDRVTWYLLIGTFGIAFGVIFVLNRMGKKWRNLVYGEGNNVPTLNVVGTFFGIALCRLPKENFPRALLLLFIFFCLIIRTAYQGVFFEMMTTDMRKELPKSIEDLIERNYSTKITYFEELERFPKRYIA
jgi:hypothetical protein